MPVNQVIFDVFISYALEDGEWVVGWLKPRFQQVGLKVLDQDGFDIGFSQLRNIENAVLQSAHTLLVLSPAWLESKWGAFQSLLAHDSQLSGVSGRILPIIYQPCQLPRHIEMLTKADLSREETRDQDFDRLLVAIKGERRLPDFDQGGDDKILVPFINAAMTRLEAEELFSEKIFENAIVPTSRNQWDQLRELKAEIGEHGIRDYSSHYDTKRDNWTPHCHPHKKIREVVAEMAEQTNRSRRDSPGSLLIKPDLVSEDFFQRETRMPVWRRMRQLGGIILLDAISLFHPFISDTLSRSEMSSNELLAILVIYPTGRTAINVNRVIEQTVRTQMESAFSRFGEEWDWKCEIGAGDVQALQRWLYAVLPAEAAMIREPNPKPANRKILHDVYGEPRGMQQLIVRARGNK
ncbi:MAG: toll/interleukin-1 receptor domain-containing protein [Anaerolineae bacterium]